MQLAFLFTTCLLALLPFLPGPNASTPRYQAEDKLAPYVGTWVGHTPTGEFKLLLRERRNFPVGDTLVNLITGGYAYLTQEGQVNESISLPAEQMPISCSVDCDNPKGLFGYCYDAEKRKGLDVKLSFTDAANTHMIMCLADDNNPGGLTGSFYDVVNRRGFNIRLSFMDAAKAQLLWVITGQREAISHDPAKPVLPGVSVPCSLILTRVK